MFIISHRGQVKETAYVSAVISKVSNLLFILSFSILRCNIAAIAQNIRFLWCINNSVIAQNICLCLCPILCPIEGKWKKVLMYLISSPTCLHSPASRLHKGNGGLQVKKKYSSMYSIEKVLHQKGTQQGCISCGILVSGIRARGVSSEHMENMEMFSCSPT